MLVGGQRLPRGSLPTARRTGYQDASVPEKLIIAVGAHGDPTGEVMARSPREIAFRKILANKAALVGLILFALVLLVAVLAPVVARYDPSVQFPDGLRADGSPVGPSAKFWLGTDDLGRDLYSRLIYGARTSMQVAVLANAISTTIGVVVGSVAGFAGGLVDTLLMRFTDAMMSFPVILFAAFLVAVLEPSTWVLVLVIGFVGWFYLARIVRVEVLAIKRKEFVQAARCIGVGRVRILLDHVLPQVSGQVMVFATLSFSTTVLYEAVLSYLGIGVQPPTPSWGNIISGGTAYIATAPWMVVFPGVALATTVLALNLLGDGLRDALDPRG